MRLILLRHGESYNNVLYQSVNFDSKAYREIRGLEPKVSEVGEAASLAIGAKMAEMGLKFSKIMCSAQKRALITAKLVRDGLNSVGKEGEEESKCEQIPIHLYVRGHEFQGTYLKNVAYPGLSTEEVKEVIPDIVIDENQKISELGWNIRDTVENHEEVAARIKDVIRDFKEEHKKNPDQTILLVSHGFFMKQLMIQLTSQQNLMPHCRFLSNNNSIMIVDFVTCQTQQSSFVEARLQAYNLQLIENTSTQGADQCEGI